MLVRPGRRAEHVAAEVGVEAKRGVDVEDVAAAVVAVPVVGADVEHVQVEVLREPPPRQQLVGPVGREAAHLIALPDGANVDGEIVRPGAAPPRRRSPDATSSATHARRRPGAATIRRARPSSLRLDLQLEADRPAARRRPSCRRAPRGAGLSASPTIPSCAGRQPRVLQRRHHARGAHRAHLAGGVEQAARAPWAAAPTTCARPPAPWRPPSWRRRPGSSAPPGPSSETSIPLASITLATGKLTAQLRPVGGDGRAQLLERRS